MSGEGFFRVQLASGDFRYTRDGSFRPDGNGALVTAEGHRLDPAVLIPTNAIEVIVGEDGVVSIRTTEGDPPEQLTNISIFRFPNPTGLKATGGNLYVETQSSGPPQGATAGLDGTGVIKQGFLERSNVAVVDELVALILAQRNYEINSRAIRVSDEMLEQINQIVR
jgi:flagellar basal-body rod protein FlgG